MLSRESIEVKPQVKLGTEYIADFVIRIDKHRYTLVEIEQSTHLLYRKDGTPTSTVTHAEKQVEDWLEWVYENLSYARKTLPNIHEPQGWIVIGREHTLTEGQKVALARRNSERHRIQLLTHDDLLIRAKQSLLNVSRLRTP